MASLLTANHLLTLFFVVGLGAVLGGIRFGPLRFGAAGALFVGLAVSAWSPGAGEGMGIVQQIGLAFFVYTVGVSAGSTFAADLRKQAGLLVSCALVCLLGAIIAIVLGPLLGLSKGLTMGVFTGALTAAPALDAATRVTGDPSAAVGYAFGYPIGVVIGIVVVTVVVSRRWTGARDTPSLAGAGLDTATVRVRETVCTREIVPWREQRIRMSYLRRDGRTRVVVPGEDLHEGDLVLLVGDPVNLSQAAPLIGEVVDRHLEDDRTDVAFERIVVSNPDVAGRTVSELNIAARFGAVITRVRRGDLDLLARDDLALQLGDHAAVVVPTGELDAIQTWLGDSQKRVAEVDAMAFGVGMVLGALRRTGPVVWTLPGAANLTIRQIGLMLFLAALGLNAGPDLSSLLASPQGWRAGVLAVVVVAACCCAQAVAGRVMGLSAPRTAGGVAGFLGQPAVLQAADARVPDERIEAAYATLFAFSIVVKILMIPLIWAL
ncbi:transporter [Actinomyces sp. B33]|uniref:aspartate-alanine antiporter-like transporter n=1 Tax=Actinomyces sp. B33 TaxID=2942131 RepID=UPI002341491E|nr:TrkA C-terminal domain-containing protein [Actinomyces sp. B33]MDC4232276.1 transporter [Actinomyces sp. B33]